MKTKKLLSILLALMMMLSVVPFYASAAAETLTASNIQTLPTITVNDLSAVKLYTGTYPDKLFTIADDEVVVDAAGNQVAGHFVVRNAVAYDAGEAVVKRLNITFLPDDTEAYTSFNKNRITVDEFTIVVEKADVALIDAENDYPRTTEAVPSGTAISDIRITGGGLYNVQNPTSNTYLSNASWSWKDTSLVVTESGYYDAVSSAPEDDFNDFVVPVYIEVESNIEATTIVEAPTATIEYGTAWNEVVLFEGGKVMAGDTEVSGTFTRKSTSTTKPAVGEYSLKVIFTPDDLEKYAPCEGTAVVTVTKGNYKFVNENGEEIVPELTLPYGTTFNQNDLLGNSLKAFIKDYDELSGVDIVGSLIFEAGDYKTVAPVGTNTYNVRVRPYNSGTSNYNVTDLQFILTIEPVIITTTASWGTNGVIKGKLSHEAKGTLDVFVDGKLVADDIKAGGANNEWSVDYPIPATGDYTIKVVYNPTENDPYSMVDFEKVVTAKIRRSITYADPSAVNHKINGDERTPIATLGDTIELSTFGGVAFLGWKITDASGNEVDLGIADLTATEITFTMPDYDLFVEAMYQKDEPADDNGGLDIDNIFGDLGDLTEGDSDNPIINIFNNIIDFIKNIIETIISLFRGIGDRT
ncbi:MAG: hypothetical protein IJ262_01650 [Clostridia bacterium]|nr:hypothetical protein [Clostridia bacterium]